MIITITLLKVKHFRLSPEFLHFTSRAINIPLNRLLEQYRNFIATRVRRNHFYFVVRLFYVSYRKLLMPDALVY